MIMVVGMNGMIQAVIPTISGLLVIALNINAPQNKFTQVPKTNVTIEKPFQVERSSIPSPMI